MSLLKHLPNALTLLRLVSAPVLAALLCSGGPSWHMTAAFAVFVAAAVTDHLDGFLARRLRAESAWGRQFDPIADKLLTAAALLGLSVSGLLGGLHLVAVGIILAREIIISFMREHLALKGAELPVMPLARIKTTAQSVGIGLLIGAPLVEGAAPAVWTAGLVILWTAAALTAWTGALYVRRAIDLLRRPVEHAS